MMPKPKAKPAHISQKDWDDVDSPEWTAADFADARPASEIVPDVVAKMRGRPKAAVTKVPVTLRLDPDVVATFKASGAGWQTRMNEVLGKAAGKIGRFKIARIAGTGEIVTHGKGSRRSGGTISKPGAKKRA